VQEDRRRRALAAVMVGATAELAAAAVFFGVRSHPAPRSPRPPSAAGGSVPPTATPFPEVPPGRVGTGTFSRRHAHQLGPVAATGAPIRFSAPAAPSVPPAPASPSTPGGSGTASAPVATPSAAVPAAPSTTAAPLPVVCQTDLALSRSPDAGYNFLCRQGSRPLTWATGTLTIYESGLSSIQALALSAALPEWEAVGRFQVTRVNDRRQADVVITTAPLAVGQPGYTEDGYTTVSYLCAPRCAYYHANMVLSSTTALTQTDWQATALHELGHAAGLNHVARTAEVMYPYLAIGSPAAYAAGDRQGLAVLAATR